MKDFAKTYFASLVCSHPDGKAQAKRVHLCVIKISCTRSAAWSLRLLRSLRENIKERLVHFEQIHILRVTSIYRTVIYIIKKGAPKFAFRHTFNFISMCNKC